MKHILIFFYPSKLFRLDKQGRYWDIQAREEILVLIRLHILQYLCACVNAVVGPDFLW